MSFVYFDFFRSRIIKITIRATIIIVNIETAVFIFRTPESKNYESR